MVIISRDKGLTPAIGQVMRQAIGTVPLFQYSQPQQWYTSNALWVHRSLSQFLHFLMPAFGQLLVSRSALHLCSLSSAPFRLFHCSRTSLPYGFIKMPFTNLSFFFKAHTSASFDSLHFHFAPLNHISFQYTPVHPLPAVVMLAVRPHAAFGYCMHKTIPIYLRYACGSTRTVRPASLAVFLCPPQPVALARHVCSCFTPVAFRRAYSMF